jgi:hypothetical protein
VFGFYAHREFARHSGVATELLAITMGDGAGYDVAKLVRLGLRGQAEAEPLRAQRVGKLGDEAAANGNEGRE